MTADSAHFTHSALRERIVEHVFVGQVLRELWRRKVFDVEVLRGEFDAHGYDLVFARAARVRHVQLKTGSTVKPVSVSVATSLAQKPSGCVVWIKVDDSLELQSFFFFGGELDQRLPALDDYELPKRATHRKDGVRPLRVNHRLVPGKEFKLIEFGRLVDTLFGL
jgi:hypothetical protein